MPTYEYECNKCGKVCELFQSITERPRRRLRKTDPKPCDCNATVTRRIGTGGGPKQRTVTLPSHLMCAHGIDRWAKARALAALETAGLVSVAREAGRTARVTVLDVKNLP